MREDTRREQDLLASASVLSAGKRLVVCRLEVTSDGDRVVAAAQATYVVLQEDR